MARDDFKNLGYAEADKAASAAPESAPEKGVKGELRW